MRRQSLDVVDRAVQLVQALVLGGDRPRLQDDAIRLRELVDPVLRIQVPVLHSNDGVRGNRQRGCRFAGQQSARRQDQQGGKEQARHATAPHSGGRVRNPRGECWRGMSPGRTTGVLFHLPPLGTDATAWCCTDGKRPGRFRGIFTSFSERFKNKLLTGFSGRVTQR